VYKEVTVEFRQRIFLGVGVLADGIAKSRNGIQVRLWFRKILAIRVRSISLAILVIWRSNSSALQPWTLELIFVPLDGRRSMR
jgi:hypothetical protein